MSGLSIDDQHKAYIVWRCRLAKCDQWRKAVFYRSTRTVFSLPGRSHVWLPVELEGTSEWAAANSRPVCTIWRWYLWLNRRCTKNRSLPRNFVPLSAKMHAIRTESDHIHSWTSGSFTCSVWIWCQVAVGVSEERRMSRSTRAWWAFYASECEIPSPTDQWLPW